MRRIGWTLGLVVACASEPPPRSSTPLEVAGVRQNALTEKEIMERIQLNQDQLRFCYGRERYNLNTELSDFTFIVKVPNDGTGSKVRLESDAQPNQLNLAECLQQTLERVSYPRHVGAPLTLRVPIKAPK
jgi:hypothetical protein